GLFRVRTQLQQSYASVQSCVGIGLEGAVHAQSAVVESDPARARAGFAVRDAVEVRSEDLPRRVVHLCDRVEIDAADQQHPTVVLACAWHRRLPRCAYISQSRASGTSNVEKSAISRAIPAAAFSSMAR